MHVHTYIKLSFWYLINKILRDIFFFFIFIYFKIVFIGFTYFSNNHLLDSKFIRITITSFCSRGYIVVERQCLFVLKQSIRHFTLTFITLVVVIWAMFVPSESSFPSCRLSGVWLMCCCIMFHSLSDVDTLRQIHKGFLLSNDSEIPKNLKKYFQIDEDEMLYVY